MSLLAYIMMTSPWMWAGLGLAGLPIMAHLLNRFARTRRVYPSLTLLRTCAAQQLRIWRLRRWLLLLLRCLTVAMVVAAFVRPVWQVSEASAVAAGQRNAVVLLLDVSASMRVPHNGVPLFDVAREAAKRVLADLRTGLDVAELILVDDQPAPLFGELSPNLPALQAAVNDTRATFQRADAVGAMRAASQLLDEFVGVRQIVILSDLQATSWQPVLDGATTEGRLPTGTRVSVIDLQAPHVANLSVHSPRHDPAQPVVGQTAMLSALVSNHTSRPHQVRVVAKVDELELESRTVNLEPGRQQQVGFPYSSDDAQPHRVEIAIDRDAFPLDDRCFGTVTAAAGLRVGLLSDDDPQQLGSASYHLTRALAPRGDRNDRFEVVHFSTRDLPSPELAQIPVMLVGYLALLDDHAADALVRYVARGGSMIVFCGQGPVRRNLDILDRRVDNGWLPWVTGSRRDLQRDRRHAGINAGRWRSRLLREFDLASQTALSRIRFGHVWQVQQVRAAAEVLLTFDVGDAALGLVSYEQGRIMLANFSPDAESSDLGKHGAFVALAQILAQNLQSSESQESSRVVGSSITRSFESSVDPAALNVLGPDGEKVDGSVTVQSTSITLQVPRTQRVGFYRVMAGDVTVDRWAVNLAPSESDLRPISAAQLRASLSGDSVASPAESTTEKWHKPIDLRGRPLWGWMVLAACAFLGAEMGLLAWWRR